MPVAAVAIVALLAGGLSGCNVAPPAAIVNGEKISVPELDQQIQGWASSPAFVSAENALFNFFFTEAESEAEQQGGGAPSRATVQGFVSPEGGNVQGQGTYSSPWVALVLSNLVLDVALRQHLSQLRESPSTMEYDAAWQSDYAQAPVLWRQLSPALRAFVAGEGADEILVARAPASAHQDQTFYKQNSSYFWSKLCVSTSDVTVAGPDGRVDWAATLRRARAVARAMRNGGSAAGITVSGGASYCDTPEQFIQEPLAFQAQVGRTAPSQVATVRQSYGYQVVLVLSRTTIPDDSQTAEAIEASGAATGTIGPSVAGAIAPPNGNQQLTSLLARARVDVDPQYGDWDASPGSGCAPQVASEFLGPICV
ncbi:MAG TPA: hypothetical protein VME46_00165 [Acidimicrobiales bacterium]|nr:hypothetical protein [Acidimicrobiales bacterium]